MKRLLLAALLFCGPAIAQTPPTFTYSGRAAQAGDPVSLSQVTTAIAAKTDVTINLGPGFSGTVAQMLSGAARIRGLNVSAAQTVPVVPVGNNAADTLGSVIIQGPSVSALTRQFMAVIGMTSATGGACVGPQCGNVALYTAIDQQAGSADAWTQNTLCNAGPGVNKYLQCIEVDVDNNRGDTGTETANWIGGITLTGTNAQAGYLNRQALMVGSGLNRALWHAGLLGDDNSIQDALVLDRAGGGTYSYWNRSNHSGATFFDQGTSTSSLSASGTYTRAAITTENGTTPVALAAKAGQKVCFAGVHACAWYDVTAGKWMFTDENDVVLLSIAKTTGNAVFKGTVTQSSTP